jgi:hypothetical protein
MINNLRLQEIGKEILMHENAIVELTHEVANVVKDYILSKYPNIKIEQEEMWHECYEVWLRVDKDIYNTDDFMQVVTDIDINIILPSGAVNIMICYK